MVRSDGQFLVAAAGFSEKGRKRKTQNLEWLINVKFRSGNYFSQDKIPPSIVLLSYLPTFLITSMNELVKNLSQLTIVKGQLISE